MKLYLNVESIISFRIVKESIMFSIAGEIVFHSHIPNRQ